MMRVDLEQKILVHSSSRDEGLHGKSMEACPTVNLVSPIQLVVSRVLRILDTSTVIQICDEVKYDRYSLYTGSSPSTLVLA
jgi:hypothetical protein